MHLLGGAVGTAENSQNTVLCLFEPDAEGLEANDFPTFEEVWFGTRPGRRRIFGDEERHLGAVDRDTLAASAADWFRQETGREPDPAMVRRVVWEWLEVQDGDDLARVMRELAERHPPRPETADEPPRLPVMPDLTQALNLAACDSRAVIALVRPEGGDDGLERTLARLAFAPGLAGRAHHARLDLGAWAFATEVAQVQGATLTEGVFLIAPDPWGLEGEVWAEFPADVGPEALRDGLRAGLERFRDEWRKQDRTMHMRTALEQGLTWTEYDADADAVLPIGEDSSKLGREITYH